MCVCVVMMNKPLSQYTTRRAGCGCLDADLSKDIQMSKPRKESLAERAGSRQQIAELLGARYKRGSAERGRPEGG